MKLRNFFLAAALVTGMALATTPVLAQEGVCEIISRLAQTVGKGRENGLTQNQQKDIAKIALAQNGNKEIYKLHLGMVENAYKNDLDGQEMAVIYYLACSKSGLK